MGIAIASAAVPSTAGTSSLPLAMGFFPVEMRDATTPAFERPRGFPFAPTSPMPLSTDNHASQFPSYRRQDEDGNHSLLLLAVIARVAEMLRQMEENGSPVPASPGTVRAITRHPLTKKLAAALGASTHTPDTSSCTICCRTFEEIVGDTPEEASNDVSLNREPRKVPEGAAVCLEEMDDSVPDVLLFPCHHAFCSTCAERWLAQSDVCPNCRQSVTELLKGKDAASDETAGKIVPQASENPIPCSSASSPVHKTVPQWWLDAVCEDTPTADGEAGSTHQVGELQHSSTAEQRACTAADQSTMLDAVDATLNDDSVPSGDRNSPESFFSAVCSPAPPLPARATASPPAVKSHRLEARQWTGGSPSCMKASAAAGQQQPQQQQQRRLSSAVSFARSKDSPQQLSGRTEEAADEDQESYGVSAWDSRWKDS
jgi:hypothetical protein